MYLIPLVIACVLQVHQVFAANSLYANNTIGIVERDGDALTSYLNDNLALIQYYNTFCGACISYKPIYEKVVTAMEYLIFAIKPVTVACNKEINTKQCSAVKATPTFMCSIPQANGKPTTIIMKKPGTAAEYLERAAECFSKIKPEKNPFIPKEVDIKSSYLLEGSDLKDLSMLYLNYTRRLLEPVYFRLKASVPKGKISVSHKYEKTQQLSFDEVNLKFSKLPHLGDGPVKKKVPQIDPNYKLLKGVYTKDMLMSIQTMLSIDVLQKLPAEGDKRAALLEFLGVLKIFGAFSEPHQALFTALYDLVKDNEKVTSKAWKDLLDSKMQRVTGPYQACQGSEPNKRRYPCGLWTLFHALTVSEYLTNKKHDETNAVPMVPHALNRFVPRFFSCTECAVHFAAASSTVRRANEEIFPEGADQSVLLHGEMEGLPEAPKNAAEAVVWLNILHNRVNKRLAGDATEDTKVPKRFFPSPSDCPNCYSKAALAKVKDDPWAAMPDVRDQLLTYLVDYYVAQHWNNNGLPTVAQRNACARLLTSDGRDYCQVIKTAITLLLLGRYSM